MDDTNFLACGSDATATIMVLLPDGSATRIANVSPLMVLDKCPLLYHALEFGEYDLRQASIEATSRYAIVSLLRYIYTGNYLAENEPSFLLNHAETYKIAENYDMPDLQVSAYVNFSRQTEFSCSLKDPPVLLCETVRFLYGHLASHQSRQEQSLVDTLLNYCLAVFAYQGLGERADFRQVVFDLPAFHKDLCRTSMQREFLDDGALDIVRLPVSSPTPHSHDSLQKRALGDFQFDLWQDSEESLAADDSVENSPSKRRTPDVDGLFTLVHRPKDSMGMPTFSESESENESSCDELGFMLVHRPRHEESIATVADCEPGYFSSPEMICAVPAIVKAEPQNGVSADASDYAEEDWSLI
ncbi:hypothetical protein K458DRAFT_333504 [Lentithecium fluviatile CBS 122367]|uniref:BTB domain-containing protein n=1 Tax=Lentithecium fluviatile CBS 122367 TaxID=1168545 RepID=A0A6G1JAT0_9PLEO|nr:hypothetical protein K458DRAFT_333504 [Lentithecium fluviatile CBS 122367]